MMALPATALARGGRLGLQPSGATGPCFHVFPQPDPARCEFGHRLRKGRIVADDLVHALPRDVEQLSHLGHTHQVDASPNGRAATGFTATTACPTMPWSPSGSAVRPFPFDSIARSTT